MMWAITSYYNPAGYERRRRNYETFRKRLAVPLLAVEMSFDGRFELRQDDADILIQVSGGAVLWQKERLLNLAISHLPAEVDNVAWIDCDVIFDRDDWVAAAERLLARAKIVQLFSEAIDIEPDETNIYLSGRGIYDRSEPSFAFCATHGAPSSGRFVGLAWAAKRNLLRDVGLYDGMVIGGGDRAIVAAALGTPETVVDRFCLDGKRASHYLDWARRFRAAVMDGIDYVDGRVFHLWHGDLENRQYSERHRLLAGHDFCVDRDLVLGPNGTWHWAKPRPDLEAFLEKYFHDRAEDSVPESVGSPA